MSRIRTVKPEFWTSEQVVKCPLGARLLFIGLWNFCDDAGIHPLSAYRIKMEIFPGDNFTIGEIEGWIKELLDVGLLQRYTVDGVAYLQVTGWHHQRIEKPTFRYPRPKQESKFDDHSTTIRRGVVEESSRSRRGVDDHSTTALVRRGGERNGIDLDLGGGEDLTHCTAPLPPPLHELNKLAKKAKKTSLDNLDISEEVRKWAEDHGYGDLDTHLEVFKEKVSAHGYKYADLDAALKVAIREDWAKVRQPKGGGKARVNGKQPAPPTNSKVVHSCSPLDEHLENYMAALRLKQEEVSSCTQTT